jgi:hypothetical protein
MADAQKLIDEVIAFMAFNDPFNFTFLMKTSRSPSKSVPTMGVYAKNGKLFLGDKGFADQVFDDLPSIARIFTHCDTKKMQRVDAERLSKSANLVDRELGLTLLEHGNDVWLFIAHIIGNFALRLAANVDLLRQILCY